MEIRNIAGSNARVFEMGQAVYNDWTINKAVKEGYKISGWVFTAVSLISQQAGSVPFVVRNPKDEIEWEHPITKMFAKPNPEISRQKLFELLVSWLQLGGNGYHKVVELEGAPVELWPVSPDRIAPIPSKKAERFIDGYEIIDEKGNRKKTTEYTPDNTIHFKLMDPSDPLIGTGPLQAAARSVDLDNSQQDWNVSAMQNRGVVDGVFTFKQPLDEKQSKSILDRIKKKFQRNKREPLVIGSEATYKRLSLTPEEMDFINSRKFNREEIFIIFGVPPQLAGTQEVSTYNNFSTSMRIFWEKTIIPILMGICDTLNMAFSKYLDEGYYISYDLSNVAALSANEEEKATTAKLYFDMGIPVSVLNEKLELGLTAYPGWDIPFSGKFARATANPMTEEDEEPTNTRFSIKPFEKRNIEEEFNKRDTLTEGPVLSLFKALLNETQKVAFESIDKREDPTDAIRGLQQLWVQNMNKTSVEVASEFVQTVVTDTRGNEIDMEIRAPLTDEMLEAINIYLDDEAIMLNDYAQIESTTSNKIVAQVSQGITEGKTVQEIKQAIQDTGVFSEARALTLARTMTGTAASIGQLVAGQQAGATKKTWVTSFAEVREIHTNREGETVGLEERFSLQSGSVAPRFPLDPQIDAADRVNCRCAMTFEV